MRISDWSSDVCSSDLIDLGLTYAALREINPRLVCVALTGFGLTSPYAERPAYDYIIQAMTGVMELTGDPGTLPTKTGYSAVDNSAGAFAALRSAERRVRKECLRTCRSRWSPVN